VGAPWCPACVVIRVIRQEQARRPTVRDAEPHSGAEQRARMTGVASLTSAHIGTSGVLAYGKHAWSRVDWATPRAGSGAGGRERSNQSQLLIKSARTCWPCPSKTLTGTTYDWSVVTVYWTGVSVNR